MTPPWATCARCDIDLYPRLARRADDGWVHKECPRFCGDCGTEIGCKVTSGLCRSCYERRRIRSKPHYGRKRGQPAFNKEPRPCSRCGISTRRKDRLCRDCCDVLGTEIERWAA